MQQWKETRLSPRSERYWNDTGIAVFKKIHIIRKIKTGIRYEPVYHPALPDIQKIHQRLQ